VSQTPKRPNSLPRPWEQGGDADAVSFGTWLRRQREIRDIGLQEIAEATKISIRYLDALEQDRFELLPAAVFARGFLREYSRYVGINPDEAVNYFLSAQGQDPGEPESPAQAVPTLPKRRRDWLYGATIAAGILALLGVVALLAFLVERRGGVEPARDPASAGSAATGQASAGTPPELPASPAHPDLGTATRVSAPQAEVVPAPPSVPRLPVRVEMEFSGNCWVERVIDDGDRLSELRVAGEALTLEAERSIVLTLGDAQNVRVTLNGKPVALSPDGNNVVRDLRLELPPAGGAASSGSPG
jgi:cytoskeletal protein RodZ